MASPTLETPRLILRTIAPVDREAIVDLLSDKTAMEHMHYASWNDEQCQGWVDTALEIAEQSSPDGMTWIIERKDTREVIGYFGIGTSSDPTTDCDISFGYALARRHSNQGYMTEATRAVFAHEFDTLGVPQLSATCRAPNVASARVMEKAGMRRVNSDYGVDFEGNWSHRSHYRITRDEWRSQQ